LFASRPNTADRDAKRYADEARSRRLYPYQTSLSSRFINVDPTLQPKIHTDTDANGYIEPHAETRQSKEARHDADGIESEDEEQSETEAEDEEPVSEQRSYTRNSIWRPTGGFEGSEPRNLRARRERSASPQDHWGRKPWEEK
jgi:hypothetical protein